MRPLKYKRLSNLWRAFIAGPTGVEPACDINARAARTNRSSGFLSSLEEYSKKSSPDKVARLDRR
jgi:hypothetical protein